MLNHPLADRVLADDFLAGLTDAPIEALRRMRTDCEALEQALSYARRLAQGRLDIVATELSARRQGEAGDDLHSMIDRLPEILADHCRPAGGGPARPMRSITPSALDSALADRVEAAASARELATLHERDEDELAELTDRYAELERELSGVRRLVHARIDALQAELTHRYQSGAVSVESLLS
ncbi:MAG: hypothetical protein ACKVWR_14545 [Acidimicrobiales bacterium]